MLLQHTLASESFFDALSLVSPADKSSPLIDKRHKASWNVDTVIAMPCARADLLLNVGNRRAHPQLNLGLFVLFSRVHHSSFILCNRNAPRFLSVRKTRTCPAVRLCSVKPYDPL